MRERPKESTYFTRIRMAIGANHKVDLPWEPGVKGWTTGKDDDGVEVIIKATWGQKSFILEVIHVDIEHRKKGLAKNKLKEILEQTAKMGMNCQIFVNPKAASAWAGDPQGSDVPEKKLKKFYKSLGFEDLGFGWMEFVGADHANIFFSKHSSLHRAPKPIAGLRELKNKVKNGEVKKGTYSNGKEIWSVDSKNKIHKVVGGKPEFDWHSMLYKVNQSK